MRVSLDLTDVQLANRAYVVCKNCGKLHGREVKGNKEAVWQMKMCDICRRRKEVTDFRNFGFSKYPYTPQLKMSNYQL